VRKLIGSKKKGKRILDKSVKEVRPVDNIDPEEYSLDGIGMDEYLLDSIGPEDYSLANIDTEEYSLNDIVMDEYLLDDADLKDYSINDADLKEYLTDDAIMEDYSIDDIVDEVIGEEQLTDEEENPENQPAAKKGRRKRNIKIRRIKRPWGRRHIVFAVMLVVGVFFVAAALRVILRDVIEDAVARSEYEQLREEFPQISGHSPEQAPEIDVTPDEIADVIEETIEESTLREYSLDELAAINPDFVGWITANNNAIDYPVVRGNDNERYINTTFFGTQNSAGAIFMDYRNKMGFDDSIVLLYGHRTRDRTMFSSLINHLDPEFRRRNPNIEILTRDGTRLTYVIFAAKLTDAWDPAYAAGTYDLAGALELFPNAPANAKRFLLLSTCTSSSDDDERVLIFAASIN